MVAITTYSIAFCFLASTVACFTSRHPRHSCGRQSCGSEPFDTTIIGDHQHLHQPKRRTELCATNESHDCDTNGSDSSTRREWVQTSGYALASMLLVATNTPSVAQAAESAPQLDSADDTPQRRPRTIIVTGSNSGVGFEACKQLLVQQQKQQVDSAGITLVLACRTLEKATDAVDRLREYHGDSDILVPAECNLASLKSVQQFVTTLSDKGLNVVDALCLNAGLCRNTAATDVLRTEDGFELTVGTNHFGHFYLNHLLLPKMNKLRGRIIVTASGVHDPASPGGAQGVPATLGDLQGLEQKGRDCEMIDGGAFNADKAYKDSKLCNVLFTRELQRRLDASDSSITANCFNPGLIVGTGLFRDQNPVFTKLFDFAATDLFKVGETPEWGGGCLAYMTNVDTKGLFYSSSPGSSKFGDSAYGTQFAPMPVSKEAQDAEKGKRLWELTEKALGIV